MSRTDNIVELLTSLAHLCFNRPHRSYLNCACRVCFPPLSLSQRLGSAYGLRQMRMAGQQSARELAGMYRTYRPVVPLSIKRSKPCQTKTCPILRHLQTFLTLRRSQCLTSALYPRKSTASPTSNTWGDLSFTNCNSGSRTRIFWRDPKPYTCTGRLVQGNHIFSLHLCITSFVKENVSFTFRIAIACSWIHYRRCGMHATSRTTTRLFSEP